MLVLKKTAITGFIAKNKKAIMTVAVGIAVFIILFFVVLSPTRRDLAEKKKAWREMEGQVIDGRRKLDTFKVDKAAVEPKVNELRKRLPSKSPTSAVLEELTKKGRELNIEFVAIAPQQEEALPQFQQDAEALLNCKVLPIVINMRATYKSLGEFLGQLENLESSFATVNEFQVSKDDRTFPKLVVNMRIYTYVLQEAESGKE